MLEKKKENKIFQWYQGAWSAWSKEVASLNICSIALTFDTFQLLSGWLKDLAFTNIQLIDLTFDTFQLLSG